MLVTQSNIESVVAAHHSSIIIRGSSIIVFARTKVSADLCLHVIVLDSRFQYGFRELLAGLRHGHCCVCLISKLWQGALWRKFHVIIGMCGNSGRTSDGVRRMHDAVRQMHLFRQFGIQDFDVFTHQVGNLEGLPKRKLVN